MQNRLAQVDHDLDLCGRKDRIIAVRPGIAIRRSSGTRIFLKIVRIFGGRVQSLRDPPYAPVFPVRQSATAPFALPGVLEPAREFVEDSLPVALAGARPCGEPA
jgi:hypothetical protein